jgi:hypothetical protein
MFIQSAWTATEGSPRHRHGIVALYFYKRQENYNIAAVLEIIRKRLNSLEAFSEVLEPLRVLISKMKTTMLDKSYTQQDFSRNFIVGPCVESIKFCDEH